MDATPKNPQDDGMSTPAPPEPDGEVVERLFTEFLPAILHGDDEHRAWLKEAVENFVARKPLPAPRGKGATPPPPSSATPAEGMVEHDWSLPDLHDMHADLTRLRSHDLRGSRLAELLRGAMDMLVAADVEYSIRANIGSAGNVG